MQSSKQLMQSADFNKKLTLEKELAKTDMVRFGNAEFDRTGNFLLYPSLIGEMIKKKTHLNSSLCQFSLY